jgi:hypothetical protein
MGALKQAYRRIGTGAFQLRLTRRTGMVGSFFDERELPIDGFTDHCFTDH